MMEPTANQYHIGLIANSVQNILHYRGPLVQMWEKKGIRITLMAPRSPECNHANAEWSLRSWIWLDHMDPYSSNPLSLLRGIRELRKVIQAQAFDQIYSFTIKPNILTPLAARGMGIHVVPTVTGLGYLEINRNWKSWLTDQLYRTALRPLSTVIFHNSDDLALFEKRRIILPGRGRIIPGSGVDTDQYAWKRPGTDWPFTVLYLGRFLVDKGLEELVSTFMRFREIHPDARLIMAGDQYSRNPTRIHQSKLNAWKNESNISCMEEVNDVKELIATASVVVLPSWREGMPRAILEAMSMGCPVIVTDVPGCRQAVEHNVTGWVLPRGNIQAMTQALVQVYGMSDKERCQIGIAGRNRVEQYFSNKVILDAYEELLHLEA